MRAWLVGVLAACVVGMAALAHGQGIVNPGITVEDLATATGSVYVASSNLAVTLDAAATGGVYTASSNLAVTLDAAATGGVYIASSNLAVTLDVAATGGVYIASSNLAVTLDVAATGGVYLAAVSAASNGAAAIYVPISNGSATNLGVSTLLQVNGATNELDQSQLVADGSGASTGFWQSFTPVLNGTLTSVMASLALGSVEVTFSLYDGEGVAGALLTNIVSTIGDGWITYTVSTPVVAERKYTYRLVPSGIDTIMPYFSSTADTYSRGSTSQGGMYDAVFKTYVTPNQTLTPTSGALRVSGLSAAGSNIVYCGSSLFPFLAGYFGTVVEGGTSLAAKYAPLAEPIWEAASNQYVKTNGTAANASLLDSRDSLSFATNVLVEPFGCSLIITNLAQYSRFVFDRAKYAWTITDIGGICGGSTATVEAVLLPPGITLDTAAGTTNFTVTVGTTNVVGSVSSAAWGVGTQLVIRVVQAASDYWGGTNDVHIWGYRSRDASQ